MTQTQLHPGVRWQWRVGSYFSFLFVSMFIGFWIAGLLSKVTGSFATIISAVSGFILLFVVIFAEIYVRMAYNRWFYEFTPDALKVERGIIWKTYKSIPYERIQNVDIRRGVFARMFGFSTVDIQTAGYSGGYGRRGMPQSEGHIPAVDIDSAEQIREFVMKKIKGKQSGGL